MKKMKTINLTLEQDLEYTIDKLDTVLKELKPYVWVVGSYANNAQRPTSDIDLKPKRRPLKETEDWETEEDYYEPEIREIINKYKLPVITETSVGKWHVYCEKALDIHHFDLPGEDEVRIVTKPLPYVGTVMDCLEYDRSFRKDENYEYDDDEVGFELYTSIKDRDLYDR